MSKISFNKLNIAKETEVKTFTFNDVEIEVKQYLDLNSKKNIIDFALNGNKDLNFVNKLVSDALFNYLLVLSYTNIELTTKKEKEDPVKVYDLMEKSGLIDAVYSHIPTQEIKELVEAYQNSVEEFNNYKRSFKGIVDTFITDIPEQLEALSSVLEDFDPNQLKILNELTSVVSK